MIHYLPTVKSEKNGFDQLAELAADAHDLYNDRLELSFSRCGFFDANMAAPLAGVLARIAADRFNRVEIVEVPPAIEKILCKNRFLVSYGYKPVKDINQTTLPYARMQLSDEGLLLSFRDGLGATPASGADPARFFVLLITGVAPTAPHEGAACS